MYTFITRACKADEILNVKNKNKVIKTREPCFEKNCCPVIGQNKIIFLAV
jgi:hypothetical protein